MDKTSRTKWQIRGAAVLIFVLGFVAGMLALSGMMMVDVMLNMWNFTGTGSLSTGIMDAFISMFGMS